jgi:apolipoprotein N-acyltransferase
VKWVKSAWFGANPEPFALKWATLLAFGSGTLYFLAFPGIDAWPLTFVALTPLIVAMHGQTPRRAAWLGWVSGFTMTMLGFYWLLDMLETFSGFGPALCLVFTAILCGYQAGRIAFLGWLYARITERGYPGWLAFALGFAASEQAFPLLFPWSYAATVHQVPALTQLAELGGPILVALPLVAANQGLAEIWLAKRARVAVPWRLAGPLLAGPVVAALYGALRVPMVDATVASAPKGRVGVVQANMTLFGKRHSMNEGLRRHVELTRKLTAQGKLDLVVWSETSVMGAMEEEELAAAVPDRFAASLHVPALFGAVIYKVVDDARKYILYNSALLTDAQGQVRGRFDKQRLVLFSESMPFGDTFPILYEWSPNSGKFVPGTRFDPLTVGNHQIATIICYEDIIAGFVNRIVNNGDPDLIANLTNDAWFGDTTEPWIHLALAQLRAVEHRRFFVRSTNSGVSAFIDPVGRVVAHGGTFDEEAIAHEIAWLHSHTLYEFLGDLPWWLISLLSVVLAFVPVRPKKPRTADGQASGPLANAGSAEMSAVWRQKARSWFARESGGSPADRE